MKTTTKKISDTRVELKVVLSAEDLKIARERAVEQLSENVKVQGFRKGKAPVNIAEKQLDPNEIARTALDIAVRRSIPLAFNEAKVSPIMMPEVNVTKFVPDETAEYTATSDILPEIKLGDYKNLKVKKPDTKVSKKEIDEVLNNVANAYAETKVVKRKAKLGDEVIIDFVGKKDDKPFAGGSAKDFKLRLGSGQFIPGFEDGIVGHESGDKFDLNLSFPKDYHAKHLAGEKVVFEVLVKQVNEVKKPELNDEFAQKCGPFKTIDDLRADIKKNLEAQNEQKALGQYQDDLVKALVDKSTVAAPEIMVKDQLRLIKDDITRNAAAQGLKFENFLEQIKKTAEEWEAEARKIAEERVKASLVLQILANQEKIEAEEEIVNAKIAELREVYKKSPEALKNLKDPRVKQDVKNRLTIEKVVKLIVDANTPAAKTEKPAAKKTASASAKKSPAKKTSKTAKK